MANPKNEKKASVFRGARHRITSDGQRISSLSDSVNRELLRANRAELNRDQLAKVLSEPTMKAFHESLYRQVGAMMADIAMEKLNDAITVIGDSWAQREFREFISESANKEASRIVDAFVSQGKSDAEVRDSHNINETTVVSEITIPELRINYCRTFDN